MYIVRISCFVFISVAFAAVVFAQSPIRKVDFSNFTYSAGCAGEEPENISVKNGEFYEEKQEDGYIDRYYFKVNKPEYGDLTGDGQEEAVILSVCNTGGTGNFSEGFIFGMKAGKAVLLARIPGGDRAHGGLREARIERGILIVESNDVGEFGGACCPEVIVTTRYRLSGNEIVETGTPTRRDLYPLERITFGRGTSGKTFKTTIPSDEGKRFVVGARSGQTLTVSVDSNEAGLRLLEEADVNHGVNNFRARLPHTGDYTVEIRNNSEKPLTFTVNIKIQ